MEPLTRPQTVRRLIDRLAFGVPAHERQALATLTPARATAALFAAAGGPAPVPPELLSLPEKGRGAGEEAKKARRQALRTNRRTLQRWWLGQLISSDAAARERLVWFWHGHFATSIQKVRPAQLMLQQNQAFRRLGLGGFPALAHALIVDPAMMVWLDAARNRKGSPNENLAREYLELFTIGHGNYTEADVAEAARTLTGWVIRTEDGVVRAVQVPRRHDSGEKTILGSTGRFGASDLAGLVLEQPASARFVVSRLWARFVSHRPPSEQELERLVSVYRRRPDGIRAVLEAMIGSDAFSHPDAALVKEPVLWLAGLARQLGISAAQLAQPAPQGQEATVADTLLAGLQAMGQLPFAPPSVGGWPSGRGWLSSGTAAARLTMATRVVTLARPKLTGSAKARVAATADVLGVDDWSSRTADALAGVADRPIQLVALAACAPEYIVSR